MSEGNNNNYEGLYDLTGIDPDEAASIEGAVLRDHLSIESSAPSTDDDFAIRAREAVKRQKEIWGHIDGPQNE